MSEENPVPKNLEKISQQELERLMILHRKWLAHEAGGQRLQLKEKLLSDLILADTYEQATFTNCVFRNTKLDDVKLDGAVMENGTFIDTKFCNITCNSEIGFTFTSIDVNNLMFENCSFYNSKFTFNNSSKALRSNNLNFYKTHFKGKNLNVDFYDINFFSSTILIEGLHGSVRTMFVTESSLMLYDLKLCSFENTRLASSEVSIEANSILFNDNRILFQDLIQFQGTFYNCNFTDVKINTTSPRLPKTILKSSIFVTCLMDRVDFSGNTTQGVITFRDCDLFEAIFERLEVTQGLDMSDHCRAGKLKAKGLTASMVEYWSLNMYSTILKGADFTDTYLRGAIFATSDLRGADFSGANLSKSDLTAAKHENIIFSIKTNLTAAKYFDGLLCDSDSMGSCKRFSEE